MSKVSVFLLRISWLIREVWRSKFNFRNRDRCLYQWHDNTKKDFVDPVNGQNSIKAQNDITVKWDESATNEKKLQRIITQKWIANFPVVLRGLGGISSYRLSEIIPERVNKSNGDIDTNEQVRRLLYSDNTDNMNANWNIKKVSSC